MNKILTLSVLAASLAMTACATNEAAMDADSGEDKAAMETQTMPAAEPAPMKKKETMETAAPAETETGSSMEMSSEMASDSDSAVMSDAGSLTSTCSHGDKTRTISVVYDNVETGTVCEVTYEKASGTQTLWSAFNERDYCLPKAEAFIAKQEGWGWSCTALQ